MSAKATPPESPAPMDSPARTGALRGIPSLTAEHADLVRAALIIVFVLLGLQLLWAARILALTAFLGVLFGLGAAPAVDALERRGFRRGVASPLIIFGVLGLVLALGAWSAPTLVTQSQELRTRFPEALEKVEVWLTAKQPRLLDAIAGTATPKKSAPAAGATTTPTAAPLAAPIAVLDSAPVAAPAESVGVAMTIRASAPPQVAETRPQRRLVEAFYRQAGRLKAVALGILTSTLAVFGGFILVIFLAVYIAAEPDLYKRGILLLVSPSARQRLDPVLTAIAVKLRRWLGTQALAMLIIGSVTTVLLSIIGVRAALPLGIIAGLLEFIPNVGPTLAAVPAIIMAFVDSPQKAFVVMVVYWGIQFLENNLLIPYLMREQLDLPPALTLMTQVVMAYVFGLMGLFVATPLLAAVFVTVQMLHVQPDALPSETAGTGTGAETGTGPGAIK
ncbi:MAG: AI-2E family transporter [Gemmatimonadaceae bacterium]|nr:AI-2E family transporter [Gemmatimonadaceae bacterium]